MKMYKYKKRKDSVMFRKLSALLLAAVIAAAPFAASLPVRAEATYFSELTGEPVSTTIQAQRPIAVMIDNDRRSYPHYGTAQADIVYELVNSIANNGVTRLMAVYKNWNAVPRIGNIRSTRPTNILLAEEYNAVLIHDGGPFYNDPYFRNPAAQHLSGSFARINNGKAAEFTEYVTTGQVSSRLAGAGLTSTYNQFAPVNRNHFNFAPYGTQIDLNAKYPGALPCAKISLPYAHNGSQLVYNALTGLYDYYEFGMLHKDGDTGATMSFKNVIIQNCTIHQYDANGYLIYNCIGTDIGYYCTNGYMVPIVWIKGSETGQTRYFDATGFEMVVNTGKTYVTLCPSTSFPSIAFN